MIGSALRNNIPNSRGIFNRGKRSVLQEVVDLVNLKYVDKVNTDTLADEAIQAMLAHLDPHSVFIPASNVEEINEDLQGNFEGIGVEFFIIDDTVHVTNVLSDGPSDKAGLQVGDKFLKVGDSAVAGKNINGDKIKNLLRGVGGSKVEMDARSAVAGKGAKAGTAKAAKVPWPEGSKGLKNGCRRGCAGRTGKA